MKKTMFEKIYIKLKKIIPELESYEVEEHLKSKVPGFMDLVFEVIKKTEKEMIISLTHYYEQNGDLVPDPDMIIRIYPKYKVAEALTFQNALTYREVYFEDKVNVKAKVELNVFLEYWLTNLFNQGHKIEKAEVQA